MQAKYLDWCSAEVADHFLALSPDEIFELAERASREDRQVPARSLSASASEGGMSAYRLVVERVTEVLTRQLELPTFESWLEQYRSDPAAIEERLLGLWRERT